ncbi:MAG: hypothetical protein WCG45_03205 [bacterium]
MYVMYRTWRFDRWVKDLILHRKYFYPAITYKSGTKSYVTNGCFRENDEICSIIIPEDEYESDEPTIVWKNGTKEWKKMGKGFHRDGNFPAIIYPNGDIEYWNCGKRHRLDGPAVIYSKKTILVFPR